MSTVSDSGISSAVLAEFDTLGNQIHRNYRSANSFFGEMDNLFIKTGERSMTDEEFGRIISLVIEHNLPLDAGCHAKFGGFFFLLSNPTATDEPMRLFGFEMSQVPLPQREALKERWKGQVNSSLLGAYGLASNIQRVSPYLDSAHGPSWNKGPA